MDEGNGSVPSWRTWTIGSFLVFIGCFAVVLVIASMRHHHHRALRCAAFDRGSPTWIPTRVADVAQREQDYPSFAAAIGESHEPYAYGGKEQENRGSLYDPVPAMKPPPYYSSI